MFICVYSYYPYMLICLYAYRLTLHNNNYCYEAGASSPATRAALRLRVGPPEVLIAWIDLGELFCLFHLFL